MAFGTVVPLGFGGWSIHPADRLAVEGRAVVQVLPVGAEPDATGALSDFRDWEFPDNLGRREADELRDSGNREDYKVIHFDLVFLDEDFRDIAANLLPVPFAEFHFY